MRIIRLAEVMATTGLGRSSIYKLQMVGKFPQSIQLSERAVGWDAYEVEAWIQQKRELRDASQNAGDIFSLKQHQYPRW